MSISVLKNFKETTKKYNSHIDFFLAGATKTNLWSTTQNKTISLQSNYLSLHSVFNNNIPNNGYKIFIHSDINNPFDSNAFGVYFCPEIAQNIDTSQLRDKQFGDLRLLNTIYNIDSVSAVYFLGYIPASLAKILNEKTQNINNGSYWLTQVFCNFTIRSFKTISTKNTKFLAIEARFTYLENVLKKTSDFGKLTKDMSYSQNYLTVQPLVEPVNYQTTTHFSDIFNRKIEID